MGNNHIKKSSITREKSQSSSALPSSIHSHSSSVNVPLTARNENIEIIFKNLSYFIIINKGKRKWKRLGIKDKKDRIEISILNDIIGIFKPGRLTAVMGSSGAGKTTLLNVLVSDHEFSIIYCSLI